MEIIARTEKAMQIEEEVEEEVPMEKVEEEVPEGELLEAEKEVPERARKRRFLRWRSPTRRF